MTHPLSRSSSPWASRQDRRRVPAHTGGHLQLNMDLPINLQCAAHTKVRREMGTSSQMVSTCRCCCPCTCARSCCSTMSKRACRSSQHTSSSSPSTSPWFSSHGSFPSSPTASLSRYIRAHTTPVCVWALIVVWQTLFHVWDVLLLNRLNILFRIALAVCSKATRQSSFAPTGWTVAAWTGGVALHVRTWSDDSTCGRRRTGGRTECTRMSDSVVTYIHKVQLCSESIMKLFSWTPIHKCVICVNNTDIAKYNTWSTKFSYLPQPISHFSPTPGHTPCYTTTLIAPS